jgi:hypothetical protein
MHVPCSEALRSVATAAALSASCLLSTRNSRPCALGSLLESHEHHGPAVRLLHHARARPSGAHVKCSAQRPSGDAPRCARRDPPRFRYAGPTLMMSSLGLGKHVIRLVPQRCCQSVTDPPHPPAAHPRAPPHTSHALLLPPYPGPVPLSRRSPELARTRASAGPRASPRRCVATAWAGCYDLLSCEALLAVDAVNLRLVITIFPTKLSPFISSSTVLGSFIGPRPCHVLQQETYEIVLSGYIEIQREN